MELRMNNKVKQSKFKRLLVISIIMAIGGYFLYFHHLFKQDRDFGFVDTENITMRSEERRVGKESRSRGAPDH